MRARPIRQLRKFMSKHIYIFRNMGKGDLFKLGAQIFEMPMLKELEIEMPMLKEMTERMTWWEWGRERERED